jgi:hypothetical protein
VAATAAIKPPGQSPCLGHPGRARRHHHVTTSPRHIIMATTSYDHLTTASLTPLSTPPPHQHHPMSTNCAHVDCHDTSSTTTHVDHHITCDNAASPMPPHHCHPQLPRDHGTTKTHHHPTLMTPSTTSSDADHHCCHLPLSRLPCHQC